MITRPSAPSLVIRHVSLLLGPSPASSPSAPPRAAPTNSRNKPSTPKRNVSAPARAARSTSSKSRNNSPPWKAPKSAPSPTNAAPSTTTNANSASPSPPAASPSSRPAPHPGPFPPILRRLRQPPPHLSPAQLIGTSLAGTVSETNFIACAAAPLLRTAARCTSETADASRASSFFRTVIVHARPLVMSSPVALVISSKCFRPPQILAPHRSHEQTAFAYAASVALVCLCLWPM